MPSLHNSRSALTRLKGNIVKVCGYPFHRLFPNKRFTVQSQSGSDPRHLQGRSVIPFIIWQTNFSNRMTLPLFANFLHNRHLSKEFDYRYVSTEDRLSFLQKYAPSDVVSAYEKLIDGAAQADLWRCFILYERGGVYMDIDATLTRPLAPLLLHRKELLISNYGEFTNFFMATEPKNPLFKEFLDTIIENIHSYNFQQRKGVFDITGPRALEKVLLKHRDIVFLPHQQICVQGAFTNEYFQYLDKPRSKWIYKDSFIQDSQKRKTH